MTILSYRRFLRKVRRAVLRGFADTPVDSINAVLGSLHEAINNKVNLPEFLKSIDDHKDNLLHSFDAKADREKYGAVDHKLAVLKITNLLVSKYQFLRRDSRLLSKPFGLLVDPSNGCNLHCPGCVHSPTTPLKFLWPSGLMSEELFRAFLDRYGPFAFKIGFFNYGEPLLNKLTPLFIRLSKDYLLNTFLSTNLSLTIDADEIVSSGLDYMIVSLDGTTGETYRKYRRGGRFEVVVRNLQKLAEAKQRQQRSRPYIVWQFLLFEHNKDEIEAAKRMAPELGVDELHLMRPFAVAWDDPEVIALETARDQQIFLKHAFDTGKRWTQAHSPGTPASLHRESTIDTLYRTKWYDQYTSLEGQFARTPENEKKQTDTVTSTCPWLYKGIVMDALGRVLPCCGAPRDDVNLVYAPFDAETTCEAYNSDMFARSRISFSDRDLFQDITGNADGSEIPYCAKCEWNKNTFFANPGDLMEYFHAEDLFHTIDDANMDRLANW